MSRYLKYISDRWEFQDDDGKLVMSMTDDDIRIVLDNLTDEERAIAVMGYLLMKEGIQHPNNLLWAMVRFMLYENHDHGYDKLE